MFFLVGINIAEMNSTGYRYSFLDTGVPGSCTTREPHLGSWLICIKDSPTSRWVHLMRQTCIVKQWIVNYPPPLKEIFSVSCPARQIPAE